MSYEFRIGLRYLYRGGGVRFFALRLIIALAAVIGGLYLVWASNGTSGKGVVITAIGMLASVHLGLLYFFSVFTTVSILGVVLGVAALTIVLSVTTGMQREFREKVLGVNAHVIVQKSTGDFKEYRKVEKTAIDLGPEVLAVQPFNFVDMVATRGHGEVSSVAVKGVDPARVTKVLDLATYMVEGKVEALGVRPKKGDFPPIIAGKVLAEKLNAKIGDEVTVVAPLSNFDVETMTARNEAPRSKKFRLAGIFYSGFDEYDRHLMYIHIADSQALHGQGDQVQGIELKVADVDEAEQIAERLDAKLGGSPYMVQDWNQLNRNLFAALKLQKLALIIILTLIIIVAAFNMVSALTMMVIDKTREIAILRSMGATAGGVARLFQVVGIGIGVAGTVCGLSIGLVLCYLVSTYNYRLDPQVYLIDRLPIEVNPLEVCLVGAITMAVCTLATLLPSFKASALLPVEGLHYE